MTTYLQTIDIPKRRAEIVAAIVKATRRIELMDHLKAVIEALPAKKLNASIGGKLHEHFIEKAPQLKVARVAFAAEKTTQFMSRGTLSIFMYEDATQTFTVQQNLDGTFDLDTLLVTYEVDKTGLEHLKRHLPQFARTAQRFNEALTKLRDVAAVAKPEGSLFPSYPLSEIYAFYQLGSPESQAAAPAPAPVAEAPATPEGKPE